MAVAAADLASLPDVSAAVRCAQEGRIRDCRGNTQQGPPCGVGLPAQRARRHRAAEPVVFAARLAPGRRIQEHRRRDAATHGAGAGRSDRYRLGRDEHGLLPRLARVLRDEACGGQAYLLAHSGHRFPREGGPDAEPEAARLPWRPVRPLGSPPETLVALEVAAQQQRSIGRGRAFGARSQPLAAPHGSPRGLCCGGGDAQPVCVCPAA
mmetsp:Transcript_101015/g.292191  ORF Transcript_101015/g.292191 Transcript_101015/m.292191 type:complete len:209 (-) Transcript_101015:146-772(-)